MKRTSSEPRSNPQPTLPPGTYKATSEAVFSAILPRKRGERRGRRGFMQTFLVKDPQGKTIRLANFTGRLYGRSLKQILEG